MCHLLFLQTSPIYAVELVLDRDVRRPSVSYFQNSYSQNSAISSWLNVCLGCGEDSGLVARHPRFDCCDFDHHGWRVRCGYALTWSVSSFALVILCRWRRGHIWILIGQCIPTITALYLALTWFSHWHLWHLYDWDPRLIFHTTGDNVHYSLRFRFVRGNILKYLPIVCPSRWSYQWRFWQIPD